MTVNLYQNTSPANYVSKTLMPRGILTGTLRSPTSILDPVIALELADPTGFNYAQIPELGRYYYVTGISSENNGIVAVSMHVDVLMTYAAQVANFDAVVKRNENKFNLYLDDGIFKAYQNTKHKIVKFPNGFTEYSYILALAGNSDSGS